KVWENEGVIVTRSLDVFISKLRKKLERGSGVKLVNVHGKGYKLEILTS
ncbi:MAG TPA: winged helix-turn-helix domain-containing protein, partial [Chitinophagaceae bacterium]|nr:winged helix-turn-helix domain-containing protein [Chitinophagaceae bacterium]